MNYIKLILLVFLLPLIITSCQDKGHLDHKEISILTPNFDKKIVGPIKNEAKDYEKKHNIHIDIISPSWEELIEEIEDSFNDQNINYDIYVVFSSWGGSLLSEINAAPIPNSIKKRLQWDDVLPIYKKNILKWNKEYYFLPYDGDCIILYYRKDIFENPEYKERFKKEYGYKLDVPKTWKEYYDIAKFFNGWDWDNDGKIEYGFAESRAKGYGTIFQFLTRSAAYTKYPNDPLFYFDRNMNPLINNKGFEKSLNEFIDSMKFAPPNIKNLSPAEVRISFITGNVAMALDWADTGAMVNNAKESTVKGKVGYSVLPGSNKVFNNNKNSWENFYNAPSSINGNWVFVVNKNSKNIKEAFDFASYMSSKKITTKYITRGDSGINPSRFSHLQTNNLDNWINSGFTKLDATNYLNTISKSLANTNVISDLKIKRSNEYYIVFDKYLNKAINNELSPKEALDLIANKWNELSKKIGIKEQKRIYKESINE